MVRFLREFVAAALLLSAPVIPATSLAAEARQNAAPAADAAAAPQAAPAPAVAAPAYAARVPAGMSPATSPTALGSLDPEKDPFRVTFAGNAAGIREIVFSNFWTTTADANAAARARKSGGEFPPDSARYVLATERNLQGYAVPVFGAMRIVIGSGADAPRASLFGDVWAEAAPGVFVTEVADASGAAVLRIERAFRRSDTKYGIDLLQRVTNLTAAPLVVRFAQYGPVEPKHDAATPMDVRRYHYGYLFPPERDPSRANVTANGQMFDRSSVSSRIAEREFTLWPNTDAKEGGYELSWFGVTDRYFTLAVHAPYAPPGQPSRVMTAFNEVRGASDGAAFPNETIFTELWSPETPVAAGATVPFDIGLYAGPLDPKVLDRTEPYQALNMGDIIAYVMSGCCSWCTFAWLADGMLWFLSLLHDFVVFDWGLAIIALVVIVRLILHPLQKKSQISMQRFSRTMQALKPELDALQKRLKDDPRRMQQEQMRLFKEKGVSPVGCVGGMLPMVAQMPIWFALYAVLFFAFELWQQPAFFGVFQQFGGWGFLADLSAPDNFYRFSEPINLWLFQLRSVNVLPLLMAVVFWIQQQYMSPPMPNATEEQLAQQRMMKWMMVILFPLMTYIVPSGLTLYILTSTCIGIIESRIIKKQVDAMDFTAQAAQPKKKKDLLGRLYEQALARAEDRAKGKDRKKFKDR
ncbi:MAG: YidC/Oxa1 family insertase periplasmic-domain containing protein [Planctomycetota bacterium]